MNHDAYDNSPTIGTSARVGLRAGASAALIYAGLFTIYAVIRSAAAIISSGDIDAGMIRTISGSGISLMIATVAFTVVALLPSSLLGLLTGLGTYGFLRIPRLRAMPRAGIAGGIVASSLLIGMLAIAGADLANGSIFRDSPETWWFWVGAPGLAWLVSGAIIGRRLTTQKDSPERMSPLSESRRADGPTARASTARTSTVRTVSVESSR